MTDSLEQGALYYYERHDRVLEYIDDVNMLGGNLFRDVGSKDGWEWILGVFEVEELELVCPAD